MRGYDNPAVLSFDRVGEGLDHLRRFEPNAAAFVSCYFDVRTGSDACQCYLEAQAEAWADTLTPQAYRDLQVALPLIRDQLRVRLTCDARAETEGLAVFVRPSADGLDLVCVRSAVALANRFNVYPVPDVLPLVELLQREPNFTLVRLAGNAAAKTMDVQQGYSASRTTWRLAAADEPSGRQTGSALHNTMLGLEVGGAEQQSVVVAGSRDAFDQVAAALSSGLYRGALHHLLTTESSELLVVEQARRFMSELARWRIDGIARRITRAALDNVPDAVAGVAASRAMLRAGLVRTLVVLPDLVRSPGLHCPGCDESASVDTAPAHFSRCGDPVQASYQPLTELVRVASKGGVEILVSTRDELRELGGVACLLAEPAERHLMPTPTLVRPILQAA